MEFPKRKPLSIKCRCGKEFVTQHSHKYYCTPKCQRYYSGRDQWARYEFDPEYRIRKLIAAAKNRAKTKTLPFNLDFEHLNNLWKEQEGRCAISGVEFDISPNDNFGEPKQLSPSLDRIIPALGYVKGNVRLVTYQINCGIGPYGLEKFIDMCKAVVREQA